MKHIFILVIILLSIAAEAQPFSQFFTEGSLRVDYQLAGDDKKTTVFIDELLREPYWGGPKTIPSKPEDAGGLRYNLYDLATGQLLYSKGFVCLFQEWQTTEESKRLQKSMPMTATMPFPKNKVRFEIEQRLYEDGKYVRIFSLDIDPADYFIRPGLRKKYEASKLVDHGDPANHVDIVFLPEGYTAAEMEKFHADASRMFQYFLNQPPFNKYKEKFNLYVVDAASAESGTDVPGRGIYRTTLLNSSYYTFDLNRYLTTSDIKTVSDIAANVPYDAIFIVVNSKIYGGGGFYNWYAMGTSDHPQADTVAIHEFGHSFGGLADEYYTSAVAYSDFYNLKIEPWEPNITTNVDFNSKWKRMIKKNTPVPTPRTEEYKGIVGMFEGGGYLSKGIFSPVQNCRMKSNGEEGFCPVCQQAIEKRIKYYCGEENGK